MSTQNEPDTRTPAPCPNCGAPRTAIVAEGLNGALGRCLVCRAAVVSTWFQDAFDVAAARRGALATRETEAVIERLRREVAELDREKVLAVRRWSACAGAACKLGVCLAAVASILDDHAARGEPLCPALARSLAVDIRREQQAAGAEIDALQNGEGCNG